MEKIVKHLGSILTIVALIFILVIRLDKGTNIFNDGSWSLIYFVYPLLFVILIYGLNKDVYQYTEYLVALFIYGLILYHTSGYFSEKHLNVGSITFVFMVIVLLFYQGGLFEQKHHREIKLLSKKGLFYSISPILLLFGIYLLNEFIIEFL